MVPAGNPGSHGQNPYSDGQAWRGQFGYRIVASSPTLLDIYQVNTNAVVGSSAVTVDTAAAQFDLATVNVSSGAVSPVNSGALAVPGTIYYVYLAGASVAFRPNKLFLSTHVPDRTAGFARYSNSGTGVDTVLVGAVQTIDDGAGNPNFFDNAEGRLVINAWNRQNLLLFKCPNFMDDAGNTTYAFNSANWASVDGSAVPHVRWLEFAGTDLFPGSAHVVASLTLETAIATVVALGIGVDTVTNIQGSVTAPQLLAFESVTCAAQFEQKAGVASVRGAFIVARSGGVAVSVVADLDKINADADTPATFIVGHCLG